MREGGECALSAERLSKRQSPSYSITATLVDIICAMVIISLNLEGSYVRISVHNAHGHQTLHCGISEDTVFLMGSFVSGGMRLGGGRQFLLFYRKFVVWVFLSLADWTRIFKSLDLIDSVETVQRQRNH